MAQTQEEVEATIEMVNRTWQELKDIKRHYANNPPSSENDKALMKAVIRMNWGSFNIFYEKLERYFMQQDIRQVFIDISSAQRKK